MILSQNKKYLLINNFISTRKGIFITLIIGKLILLPFLLYFAAKFDPRDFNILILPDLTKYENIESFLNLFDTNNFSPSLGFLILASTIKLLSNTELIKYIFYGFISITIMTFSQSLLLHKIIQLKKDSSILLKAAAIILSIINFYILIYSIKPSSDVFGCLSIIILFLGLIKYQNKDLFYKGSLLWLISILFLSLFRNNIFIAIPFIIFTSAFKCIIKDIKHNNKLINLLLLTILFLLLILNFYQFLSYLVLYKYDQESGGLLLKSISNNNLNFIENLLYLFNIFIKKLIFLISARESIAINNYDYLIAQNTNLFNYPFLINVGTALYLFITNFFGLISISTKFNIPFRNAFLFTLIPLIPLLSYWTHHRYFLAYSLFTNACLPFLFERNKNSN